MKAKFLKLSVLITIIMIISICLSGCGDTIPYEKHEVFSISDRFVCISEQCNDFDCDYNIVVDRETRVMYWMISGSQNCNGISPLLDSDGKPLLYAGAL